VGETGRGRGLAAGLSLRPPDAELATRIRLTDGRVFRGELPAARHRRLHLALLHADSDGWVEVAAGRRPPGGKLRITTRKDPGQYLPGGATGSDGWLEALLALVARHDLAGEEVFVAPAVRSQRAAHKPHVTGTNWLWIDIDGADGLPALRTFLRRKPAQLVIQSAGSGGVHVYWRLRRPLLAGDDTPVPREADAGGRRLAQQTGREAIERAHERLIYALGYTWKDGMPRPTVADLQCKDRSRVMRLAGTRNGKTGDYARIVWADLVLEPWALGDLVGDLADPPLPRATYRRPVVTVAHDDPYKRIAPVEYFRRLAGIEVSAGGLVRCPSPSHTDSTPSCHVGRDASEGWCCHGCGIGGAIYDLASALDGGPTGAWLRGDQFRRACQRVRAAIGAI